MKKTPVKNVAAVRGHGGKRLFMRVEVGRVRYVVDTEGLSKEEIAAKIDKVREHHDLKRERIDSLQNVRGAKHGTWEVTGITLRNRGTNVELHIVLRDGEQKAVIDKVYRDPASVPDDTAIRGLIAEWYAGKAATSAADKKLEKDVRNIVLA